MDPLTKFAMKYREPIAMALVAGLSAGAAALATKASCNATNLKFWNTLDHDVKEHGYITIHSIQGNHYQVALLED